MIMDTELAHHTDLSHLAKSNNNNGIEGSTMHMHRNNFGSKMIVAKEEVREKDYDNRQIHDRSKENDPELFWNNQTTES